MTDWAVYFEAQAPQRVVLNLMAPGPYTTELQVTGAGPGLDEVRDRADELMDQLADYGAVAAAGECSWSVQLTVPAESSAKAVAEAQKLVAKAAARAGLPKWPIVRLEAVWDELVEAEQRQSPLPQLLGSQEVVEALGVSRQRFHELRSDGRFPEPVIQLAATPLWLRSAVDAFLEDWDRRPGRRAEGVVSAD